MPDRTMQRAVWYSQYREMRLAYRRRYVCGPVNEADALYSDSPPALKRRRESARSMTAALKSVRWALVEREPNGPDHRLALSYLHAARLFRLPEPTR